MKNKNSLFTIFLIFALIFMAVLNFHSLTALNLHPDEAYYWSWSKCLDLGYFDNSPMIAYVDRLFTAIGGQTEFGVRIPAFLTWGFLLFFIYHFCYRIYRDRLTARLGLLIALFMPLVATGSHLMTNDIPLIFCSTFTWYFLYQAIIEEKRERWYLVGIFFGLSLLSKFQAALIAPAALVVLVLQSQKRRILLQKEPYLALGISFLIFLPVIYWNWTHQWAAFIFQMQHGVQKEMSIGNVAGFLIGQIGVFSLLFLALLYYTLKNIGQWKKISSANAFLISCFAPVFLFFCFTSLTNPAGPNWPAVVYFPAIVFLSGQFRETLRKRAFPRRLLVLFTVFSCVISLIVILLVSYPGFFIDTLGLKIPSRMLISKATYGWDQLGRKLNQVIDTNFPAAQKRNPVPVFTGSYQDAAELQFYINRPVMVFTTRKARRSNYEYLALANIKKFDRKAGLLVYGGEISEKERQYFEGIELIDWLEIERYGYKIRHFLIYRFQKLDAPALYEMAKNKPLGYPGFYRE